MAPVGDDEMMPVPIPEDMVPKHIPHRLLIVGPEDILDDKAPRPVETLVLVDGYHIRVRVTDEEIEQLKTNPHLHLVVNSNKLPPFWIGTEETALDNYGNLE